MSGGAGRIPKARAEASAPPVHGRAATRPAGGWKGGPFAGSAQAAMLALQQSAGNRAVSHLVSAAPLPAVAGSVRIHTGPAADERARDLGAWAFTEGRDIYFREGRFRPDTLAGRVLLAHELTHVARFAPHGPVEPMLQPDPGAGHFAAIRTHLARKSKDALWKYLKAHPDAIADAENLLLAKLAAGEGPKVNATISSLLHLHPGRRKAFEQRLIQQTEKQRRAAAIAVREMWKHYEGSAFRRAYLDWAISHRDGAKKKAKRGAAVKFELQRFEWHVAIAQKEYDAFRKKDPGTHRKAVAAALNELMLASGPLGELQEPTLVELSNLMLRSAAQHRRKRQESYDWTSKPNPEVLKQLQQAGKAAALATLKVVKALAAVPKGPPRKRAAAWKKVVQANEKALQSWLAVTPEGASTAALRQYLVREAAGKEETGRRLARYRQWRDQALGGAPKNLPAPVEQIGPVAAPLLTEDDRWWIFQHGEDLIEKGWGEDYSHERTMYTVLERRSLLGLHRREMGLEKAASIGTYTGHGMGRYDLNLGAANMIRAAAPKTVDLAVALGLAAGQRRVFDLQDSHVMLVSPVTPQSGSADVLSKLMDGYYGRGWSRQRILGTGAAGKKLPRRPDAARVIAALVFENTVAGSPVPAETRERLSAIRKALDKAVANNLGLPEETQLYRTVDASAMKNFGRSSMIRAAALADTPGRGLADSRVLQATNRVLARDESVGSLIAALVGDLLATAGEAHNPGVELVHHYARPGEEVWITVGYWHMRQIAEGIAKGVSTNPQTVLGQVGATGNAVSPHIHMTIAVYGQKPGKAQGPAIGFVYPPDFFPGVKRGGK